jgi:cation diffusion facilitator CzcD-associated flavoprotein CzcO
MDHFDVLIVGAGLSGVGAACHLQERRPGTSYAILEAREAIGGTWDLFRYPGIRSDSDMFTLGYSFRPWENAEAIADGPSIRRYIEETARDHGVDERIRFGHRVVRAEWSSADSRWTVRDEVTGGEPVTLTCGFLFWCSGYYRYDAGYTPHLEGRERFAGPVIHPQHWPEDLDYTGKRVVVVGSGATAVTLVPAMAGRARHVTMLQRSPSYIVSLPGQDRLAQLLGRLLPAKATYAAVRFKNVLRMLVSYRLSRRRPQLMKRLIRAGLEHQLPAGFDVDTHFTPRYDPWDQRLCLVPDGDLFRALGDGSASIVTDRIETFTESGIRLASGLELEADVIVVATGLEMELFGGATVAVDGREVDFAQTVAYKAMMFSGVPNLALALGYSNASWTLKCDLVAEYVCRLLAHMDEHGYRQVTPVAPDPSERLEPVVNLTSGYVQRAAARLPRQGARPPWRVHQNWFKDLWLFRRSPVDDEGVRFSAGAPAGDRDRPVEVAA